MGRFGVGRCCCQETGLVYVCGAPDSSGNHVFTLNKSDGTDGGVSINTGATCWGIAVDSDGNIYVASGTVLKKYDADGNLLATTSETWTQRAGIYVAADASGNAYRSGIESSSNVTVYKFDSSLNLTWAKDWDEQGGTQADYVAVDLSGNVIACGQDGGTLGDSLTTGDGYVVRVWDSSGTNTLNIAPESGLTSSRGAAVCVDSSGNIYVLLVENDGTNNYARVRKYDSSGTLQWTYTDSPPHSIFQLSGIALSSTGNIYFCGGTTANASTDPFEGRLVKIDSTGAFVAEVDFPSANSTRIRGLAVDENEDVFICRDSGLGSGSVVGRYDSDLAEVWSGGSYPVLERIDCDPGRVPIFQ